MCAYPKNKIEIFQIPSPQYWGNWGGYFLVHLFWLLWFGFGTNLNKFG